MPCRRFKRIRQAEIVSPEVTAFKRKLKLTILVTLASEKEHTHVEELATARTITSVGSPDEPRYALGAGSIDGDQLFNRLRAPQAKPVFIRRDDRT